MKNIALKRLDELLDSFSSLKILVLGDLMLDEYLWGRVGRISPEAPVPVVEVDSESIRLGGASNVVNNVSSLGAIAIPVGVVGEDSAGEQLIEEHEKAGFTTAGIIKDPFRKTTVKTRVIAHSQHVVRADIETTDPLDGKVSNRIIKFIEEVIDDIDAVLFEDYNKGVITRDVLSQTIQLTKSRGKLTAADPKFDNFFEFKEVTLFKPNKKEVEGALGIRIGSNEDAVQAGQELQRRLKCENVVLTRGAEGMSIFEKDKKVSHIETVAREVYDHSGAGDTVISALTVALAAGSDLKEAAILANHAAGVVISEIGIVPASRENIRKSFMNN